MRRLGLMGGTFDPIHFAHTEIAKKAAEQYGLDKVIFMTSGNPPHKTEKHVTDAKIRLEAVKLAIDGIQGFCASDYEVNRAEYSYSANTLKWLRTEYNDCDIYFLIGEDSLGYIEKWYHPEEILNLCTLLVYPRTSMAKLLETVREKQQLLGGDIRIIDAPVCKMSSTEIRSDIARGIDVSDRVDGKVLEFIRQNKLYGSDRI